MHAAGRQRWHGDEALARDSCGGVPLAVAATAVAIAAAAVSTSTASTNAVSTSTASTNASPVADATPGSAAGVPRIELPDHGDG